MSTPGTTGTTGTTGTRHVVVGAGLAGAAAAAAVREADADATITVLGQEPHLPYERPGLSKGYLQGEGGADDLLVHPQDWYAEQRIDVRPGVRVASLDRAAREVVTADGERLGYDRLLLATGSSPRRLPVEGADLDGVHSLRTLEDSTAVKDAIAAGGPRFHDLATSAGVTVLPRTSVEAITGTGRVEGVRLADGRTLPARTVVVAVGITPAVGLAEEAGLAVDDGVLVDDTFRTSDASVWAVGDVARAQNGWVGEQVRLEHYAAASDGGPVAGRAMAGVAGSRWDVPPFFWSDQFGVGLEYRGWADPARHHVVLRASGPASETGTPWFAFWHDAGRLVAGMHVDGWDEADTVTDLVSSHAVVDPARLADPSVPLVDVRA